MPDLFNILVCILALLIGYLAGKKVREHRKNHDHHDDQHRKSGML